MREISKKVEISGKAIFRIPDSDPDHPFILLEGINLSLGGFPIERLYKGENLRDGDEIDYTLIIEKKYK